MKEMLAPATASAAPHPTTPVEQQGIVLLGHGSRDPAWRAPIEAVAARIRQLQPLRPVSCAYLELCAPDLNDAVANQLAQGATSVSITPMFLGRGKHARQDLPQLVDALAQRYPLTAFHVQTAVGEVPRMTELMAQLACELPTGTDS